VGQENAQQNLPNLAAGPVPHRASSPAKSILFLILFSPQQMMVVLGKAVGLVADVLQEAEGGGVPAQLERGCFAGAVHFFLALSQRDEARRLAAKELEHFKGRAELTFAAVDQEDVRVHGLLIPWPAAKTAGYDFSDRREVVHLVHAADAIAAVAGLERQTVDE